MKIALLILTIILSSCSPIFYENSRFPGRDHPNVDACGYLKFSDKPN